MEIFPDAPGHLGSHPFHLEEVFLAGLGQGFQVLKMLGQKLGRGLPHIANPQGKNEAGQGRGFTALDGADDIGRGFFREALQRDQVVFGEAVEIAHLFYQAGVHQLVHDLFPQAVNVHGGLGGEMADAPFQHGNAVRVGAAGDGLAGRTHQGRRAHRAVAGHFERFGSGRTFL